MWLTRLRAFLFALIRGPSLQRENRRLAAIVAADIAGYSNSGGASDCDQPKSGYVLREEMTYADVPQTRDR